MSASVLPASSSSAAAGATPAPTPATATVTSSSTQSRTVQAYCSGSVDSMGFPRVPTVVETDYRVVYAAENMTTPGIMSIDGDFYLHMHMSGYVSLLNQSRWSRLIFSRLILSVSCALCCLNPLLKILYRPFHPSLRFACCMYSILVIGLARGHPIFERNLTVTSVLTATDSDAADDAARDARLAAANAASAAAAAAAEAAENALAAAVATRSQSQPSGTTEAESATGAATEPVPAPVTPTEAEIASLAAAAAAAKAEAEAAAGALTTVIATTPVFSERSRAAAAAGHAKSSKISGRKKLGAQKYVIRVNMSRQSLLLHHQSFGSQ